MTKQTVKVGSVNQVHPEELTLSAALKELFAVKQDSLFHEFKRFVKDHIPQEYPKSKEDEEKLKFLLIKATKAKFKDVISDECIEGEVSRALLRAKIISAK